MTHPLKFAPVTPCASSLSNRVARRRCNGAVTARLPALTEDLSVDTFSGTCSDVSYLGHFNKCSSVAEMGDRLSTIDMHRKSRGLCPFGEEGAESPSNTMSPGSRPTSLTSGILIYPAVWPQQTWTENWGCARLGGVGPHLIQCGPDQGLPPYQVIS